MLINKIYNGWVVTKAGREWTVVGRQKIRSTTWILLKSGDDTRSYNRDQFIADFDKGVIEYVRSESV